jgi:hypothetical protein
MRIITLFLAITLAPPFARCWTEFTLGDARAPISEEKFATLMLDVDNLILSAFQRMAERLLFESRETCFKLEPGLSIQGPMMDEARRMVITCYIVRTTSQMTDKGQFQEDRTRLKRATHSDGPPDDLQPCWTVCGKGWDDLWTAMIAEDKLNSASPALPTGANLLATLALSTVLGTRTRILVPLLITAWSGQAGAWNPRNEQEMDTRMKQLDYNLKICNAQVRTLKVQLGGTPRGIISQEVEDIAAQLNDLYEHSRALSRVDMARRHHFDSVTPTEGPQTNYGPSRDSLDRLTAYFVNILQDVLAYLDQPAGEQEL